MTNRTPFQVPPLTKENNDNWYICMKVLVEAYDVWEPMAQVMATEDADAVAMKKDQKELSFIYQSLDERCLRRFLVQPPPRKHEIFF